MSHSGPFLKESTKIISNSSLWSTLYFPEWFKIFYFNLLPPKCMFGAKIHISTYPQPIYIWIPHKSLKLHMSKNSSVLLAQGLQPAHPRALRVITHMVIPLMCLPTHTQSTRILHSNILISWILSISLLQRSSNSVCPILNLTLFPKDLLCLLDGDRTTSIQLSELENCVSACLPHAPHKPDTRAFLFFFFFQPYFPVLLTLHPLLPELNISFLVLGFTFALRIVAE